MNIMNECYNTPFNTLGLGDPIPAGKPALSGADFADKKTFGTGDLYPILGQSPSTMWPKGYKEAMKKKATPSKNKGYGEYLPWVVMS